MSRERDGDTVSIDELLADLPYIEARPPEAPEPSERSTTTHEE